MNVFLETVKKQTSQNICITSGIGCAGKIASYLKVNSIPADNGNALHSAVKHKSEHPDAKVIAFLNDADFTAFGINDLIEAGKKNVNLIVIYINNFLYVITENKTLPVTPFVRSTAISDGNKVELPFNIPHLAKSADAKYVARWTPLDVHRLMDSISEAMNKPSGLSVVEVISPCLMYYASVDKIGDKLDRMKFLQGNTEIKHNEPTENLDIRNNKKLIVGKFIDI
jgi:2-oxoglutarate ferredoxin oxidoreductase subunit beta